MATEIVLPQWGMEMQDGTIVRWLKREGDPIQEGEPVAEVETAKIQTELESTASGVLAQILVAEGATVPIRTPLAIVAAPGEQVSRRASEIPPSPALQRGVGGISTAPQQVRASAPAPVAPAPAGELVGATGRSPVQVVPAARRLAQQHGIALDQVRGSGPRGRILIEDVERAIRGETSPAGRVIPLAGIRHTIATRMLQSLQTMAQVTLTTEANVADAVALREGLARQWPDHGLSPLHLVIKAAARALKEHPRLNALQKEDQVQLMPEVNIGIAVSLPEGLIAPVLRQADSKSLAQVAAEVRELARKAREGKAKPEEVTGGTFTITNLGAYDIDAFTPIINPPQVAILGVGRVAEKPTIHRGEITKGAMMFLSLTFDHRIVDGAPAAEFLQTVKKHLEDPWWMVA